MSHHLYSLHDLSLVVSDKLEGEEEQVFEMKKYIGVSAFHQFKIVLCEFEWCFFEPEISWGTADDETKVYMNNMPIVVD